MADPPEPFIEPDPDIKEDWSWWASEVQAAKLEIDHLRRHIERLKQVNHMASQAALESGFEARQLRQRVAWYEQRFSNRLLAALRSIRSPDDRPDDIERWIAERAKRS